jgi:7,8-dihydropterin-6-yl-methyl-4-(beta-D-ribofuranosyl)aminobenzene 5'-phosphate synthase
MLKLTILVDNNTLIDRYLLGEPALSIFIEADGQRLLFDAGYSDAFLQNAHKLGIDLLDLDAVVLSHGHIDHTWGLMALMRLYTEHNFENAALSRPAKRRKPQLIAHPAALDSKSFSGLGLGEIGSVFDADKLTRHFELRLGEEPLWLSTNLVFLGEIERSNDFEAQKPLGESIRGGHSTADMLLDDSALACKTPDGLVVISGCAHAGICNTIEQAKRICEDERILDVVGGFHLLEPSAKQMEGTLAYFAALQPQAVHACHCTSLASRIALAKVTNLQEAGTGMSLVYGGKDDPKTAQ